MPQDSLRSMVYRAFVTCDDPDGIVECKTIRKSKPAKKLGGKVKNAKSEKNLVTSSNGSVGILDSSYSVQVKEASKGAQNLIGVVDAVSNNSLERKSENIAKDLFKGAVCLQESLKMLGKLQEVSKFMTGFKKKKSGDRMNLQMSYSTCLTDQSNVVEFQKPRLSADIDSSKDCYDELREVIRESFGRQNLLQKGFSEEMDLAERTVDSFADTTSATSSQSSMFNSHDFVSSDSSSSNVQSERPKGSNCIAKLMGLDELISKPVQFIPKLPLEKRTICDLDLPIARKPTFIVHKAKPNQRTLKEIIEIMQSKGLMRGKPFDEQARKWYPYEVSELSDDSPPIVLMKPLHNPRIDKHYSNINNCIRGKVSSQTSEEMKKKRMIREGVSFKNVDPPPEALLRSTMRRKVIGDKHVVTRIIREEATKSSGEARTRPKDKESEIRDNSNRSPIRPRGSSHITSHLQKGQVIEKRVDKIHRVVPKPNNGAEKNQTTESNFRKFTVTRENQQGNTKSKLIKRSSREPIASNDQLRHQKGTISRNRIAKTLPSSAKKKKCIKTDKLGNKQIPPAVERIGNDTIDIQINPNIKNEDGVMETRISVDHDVSDFCSRGDTNSSSETSKIIIQQNMGSLRGLSDNSEVNCISIGDGSKKSQTTVRDILSSSTTLLNHAEELFHITTGQSVMLEARSLDDDELPGTKLIFACATELLECKRQQWELTVYPLLQHPKKRPKISVSYEYLVAGICDEIGKLKENSRLSGDELVIDDFYVKLKRDLWCNEAVAGAWDLGWMNVLTWDEVELIVVDIEEHLLGVIVDELLSNFLLEN